MYTVYEQDVPKAGDNSYLCMEFPYTDVSRIELRIRSSGAVTSLSYCPPQAPSEIPSVFPSLEPSQESSVRSAPPCGGPCDDGDLCTINTCDALTNTCVAESVECGDGETCDSFTGACQSIQGTLRLFDRDFKASTDAFFYLLGNALFLIDVHPQQHPFPSLHTRRCCTVCGRH